MKINTMTPLLLGLLCTSGGCAAAVGAAMAAQELRQGFAGVQQLVANSRSLPGPEERLPPALEAPIAGTYRGQQVFGADTLVLYVRTTARPAAPIVDGEGNLMGYALAGIAATNLDTLEARVRGGASTGRGDSSGTAIFFVEGTQAPDAKARTLYPAAFLGRVAAGESARADSLDADLRALGIDLRAPDLGALSGRGLPYELFDSVADGVFTLNPAGEAIYEQDYDTADGRELRLRFDRISATTLPEPDWLQADRIAPAGQ